MHYNQNSPVFASYMYSFYDTLYDSASTILQKSFCIGHEFCHAPTKYYIKLEISNFRVPPINLTIIIRK